MLIIRREKEGSGMGRDALIGFGESDEFMIPEEKSDPDKSEHTINSRVQSQPVFS
jgi:hypothetical protein